MNLSKAHNYFFEHRHPVFLIGLLSFFILPEMFEKIFYVTVRPQVLFIGLIISSTLLVHGSRRVKYLSYGYVFTLILFIVIWNNYRDKTQMELVAYVLLFSYFSFISFFLFKDLTRSTRITPSVIIGAFAGYFLIGVIFLFVFSLFDLAYPDTVSVDMSIRSGADDMLYFSFITLTTIGYGDFSPISSLGQKVAILEGLIGQFYIATVMAILVGKFLTHKEEKA